MTLLALLLLAFGLPACFGAGLWAADFLSRQYWREYEFCPTCDRFSTEREEAMR